MVQQVERQPEPKVKLSLADLAPSKREGYLEKKGAGSTLFGRRNWNRRFVVLDGGYICYFPSRKTRDQVKLVPLYPWGRPNEPRAGGAVRLVTKEKKDGRARRVIEVDLPHWKVPTLQFALPEEASEGDARTGGIEEWVVSFENHLRYYAQNDPDPNNETVKLARTAGVHGPAK